MWRSLRCATKGLWEAVASERNVKIQLAVALLNVIAGFVLGLSAWEWVVVLLCCAIVIGAELMNTAVETTVDLVSPEYNPLAGRAKDIAAAAVWLVGLFSAIVGVLVFGRAVMRHLQ